MLIDQNQENSPLQPYDSGLEYDIHCAMLKSEFTKIGKSNNKRYIAVFDKFILVFKTPDYKCPSKFINLEFDTKFEVIREHPKLKSSAQMKLSKPETIKPEDIIKLGKINSIRFQVDNNENYWEIADNEHTTPDGLQRLRDILGERINQIGFHHMFKVFKKIGKGNFASVYLAERIEDNKQLAIKAFSKAAVYNEENGKEGLVNEINLMRQLDHNHIMKLYEVYETKNSLYMVLELLEGGQLYDYLKKKVIFQNKEIQIILKGLLFGIFFQMIQFLKALKYMHSKDIMHRDIKLENILFKKSNDINSVVLADLGLATLVHQPAYLYCRCGTPGFVAPEVINITNMQSKYDSVCDIYSLGLVFHILLTGKSAFPGRSYNSIVQQNKDALINLKSKVFEVVSPQALDLLKKMLEIDPKKRIRAEEALKHSYLQPVMVEDITDEFEVTYEEIDDDSDLTNRINKINEETQKFDMLRINQFQQSPIQTPMIHADLRQIKPVEKDSLIMKTPVMTGRCQSVERGSPSLPSAQTGRRAVNYAQGTRILTQYTKNGQQQESNRVAIKAQEEIKDIKNIKANLFRNI